MVPLKKIQCDNNLAPKLVMCFHLEANANGNDQNIAIDFVCVASSCFINSFSIISSSFSCNGPIVVQFQVTLLCTFSFQVCIIFNLRGS